MDSDNEVEWAPLPYDTPSPYKKRRPEGLPTKDRINSFQNLDKRLNELDEIEQKYKNRLFTGIFQVGKLSGTDGDLSSEKHVGAIKKTIDFKKQIGKVFQSPDLNNFSFKNYFHPDHYCNKFNQDTLDPAEFLKDTRYRNMSLSEFSLLISTDMLELPEDPVEKKSIVRFLVYFGSVTENITIARRISQILSTCYINFSNFETIIENWGRISDSNCVTTPKKSKTSPPQSYNFDLIIDLISSSIEQYSLFEIKEFFKFLIEVSRDPLFDGLTYILLEPVRICCEQLLRHKCQVADIVDIIDYFTPPEECSISYTYRVVLLLMNSGCDAEIGVTLSLRAITKTLNLPSTSVIKDDPINMNTLSRILLDNETKLFELDFKTAYQLCLHFEMIANRMPNRNEFNISPVISLFEKLNTKYESDLNAAYLIGIISRLKRKSLLATL